MPFCPANGPAEARKNGIDAEWILPIRKAELDHFRFIALHSSSALEEEGKKMHHCIATYTDRCRSSSLRAFSVRHQETDKRIATLTVFYSLRSHSWQIDQIHGPSNTEVNDRVVESSLGLLHCLDDATRTDVELQRAMSKLGRVQVFERQPFHDGIRCIPF